MDGGIVGGACNNVLDDGSTCTEMYCASCSPSLRWDVKFVATTIDAIKNHAMVVQIGRCTRTASVGNV